jgi:hypothetical protein
VVAYLLAEVLNLFYDLATLGHGNPGRMQSVRASKYYTMRPCLS